MYREDYARAGMLMLPASDANGDATFRRIVTCSLALIPVSLIPSFAGMAGNLYLVSALVLGLVFSYFAYSASLQRTKVQARQLVHATVIYLPLLYAAMVMNRSSF